MNQLHRRSEKLTAAAIIMGHVKEEGMIRPRKVEANGFCALPPNPVASIESLWVFPRSWTVVLITPPAIAAFIRKASYA